MSSNVGIAVAIYNPALCSHNAPVAAELLLWDQDSGIGILKAFKWSKWLVKVANKLVYLTLGNVIQKF